MALGFRAFLKFVVLVTLASAGASIAMSLGAWAIGL